MCGSMASHSCCYGVFSVIVLLKYGNTFVCYSKLTRLPYGLRSKLSGAVYCNRSCLFVCLFVCLWICYHDNSKLRAPIFTKLGL